MSSLSFGQTISRASGLVGATLRSVGLFVVIFLLYGAVGAASFLTNPNFGNLAARMSPSLIQQVTGGAINAVLTLVAIALPVAIYGELIDLKGEKVSGVFD